MVLFFMKHRPYNKILPVEVTKNGVVIVKVKDLLKNELVQKQIEACKKYRVKNENSNSTIRWK